MEKTWISHVEWIVMMVTLVGGFYLVFSQTCAQSARIDRIYETSAENCDRYYRMFYDMQSEIKDLQHQAVIKS
jgi:hypothetical protein